MGRGSSIRVVTIAVIACILGAVGGWRFSYVVGPDPRRLQAKVKVLTAQIQEQERTSRQVQAENQQLKSQNAAFQESDAERQRLQNDNAALRRNLRQLQQRVSALENTNLALTTQMREQEQMRRQVQTERQRLQNDNAALRRNLRQLQQRVSALENTNTALEDAVKRMRKQIGESIPKSDYKRIVSEKDRLLASNAALLQNKNRLERKLTHTKIVPKDFKAIQSLSKDRLVRLLVNFLIKYERYQKNWFTAYEIQYLGDEQEQFDLFRYHSWSTIDKKLRNMERIGLVKGRNDINHIGRLFTINHGSSLIKFQAMASN